MKRIAIAGCGISGLATGYLIKRMVSSKGYDIELILFEEANSVGGKIKSRRINGFLCEEGPNGFLDSKPAPLQLSKQLGIEDRILRSNDYARKRYIFTNGKLNLIPLNPVSFFFSNILSLKGRLRIPLEFFVKRGKDGLDETVAEFGRRRLGEEAVIKLLDPMVSGVWAGDVEKLSLSAAFPRIAELEREYGSLIKAMISLEWQRRKRKKGGGDSKPLASPAGPGGVLTSFYEGTQELTDSLYMKLKENLKVNHKIVSIKRGERSPFIIHIKDDKGNKVNLESDIVILATPAYETALILETLNPTLSQIVNSIPYAAVAMVCLGYIRKSLSHPLNGFGFLIPHSEKRKILGALWSSSIFPGRAPEESALLQVIIGGFRTPELVTLDETSMLDMVYKELYDIMGIDKKPEFVKIFPHKLAIPQYNIGHLSYISDIEKILVDYPGLILTGNAYRGVSLSDCVKNSYIIAEEVIKILNSPPLIGVNLST